MYLCFILDLFNIPFRFDQIVFALKMLSYVTANPLSFYQYISVKRNIYYKINRKHKIGKTLKKKEGTKIILRKTILTKSYVLLMCKICI